ncbi:nitroreductase/quinone reductase family protein [Nonomuraea rubra]|uniref:nitroreductase/quinone reductase family protein n=1 Tax=Nonomuraea rubra TaxID=46180 RepID=UPI0033E2EAB6
MVPQRGGHPGGRRADPGERSTARARTAEGPERERLWRMMTELAPVYRTCEARSRRQIPVVVVERS